MEITIAKSAGFCFGVERAIQTVNNLIKEQKQPLYTYGPIIHNEEVIRELEEQGVQIIRNEEGLSNCKQGYVVIRSHGVEEKIYRKIYEQGLELIDATCPFVKKIHEHVRNYGDKGYNIIIIGNKEHPEVVGTKGWSHGKETIILNSEEETNNFDGEKDKKYCIVAQTTFNMKKFQKMVEILSEKGYDIIVLNTICNATSVRQIEADELASNNDAIIVIGGKSSSNTQKLFEISKKECANTYYIQTYHDLLGVDFAKFSTVGITAGASTPNKIIEEVQKYVRNEF